LASSPLATYICISTRSTPIHDITALEKQYEIIPSINKQAADIKIPADAKLLNFIEQQYGAAFQEFGINFLQ